MSIKLLALSFVVMFVAGCALLKPLPEPLSLEERLNTIPRFHSTSSSKIEIRFNEFQVPFIFAESDSDAAFALGIVHAHLRLGQMEILRRISQQRIAEMFGPLAQDIEHTLRILDPDKAVPEMESDLPADTRMWLEQYVKGINHLLFSLEILPHEFDVLGLEKEAWTVRDVLAISRLASTEVNWLFWFGLFKIYGERDFDSILERIAKYGNDSRASFDSEVIPTLFSGSNSIVVSGERTSSGSAMIASDPHVGLNIPNLWVLVGVSSPEYHSIGISLPGLPTILLGRNQHIAWGGTNMMGLTSSLMKLTPEQIQNSDQRDEPMKTRFWFSKTARIRDTEYGPILSDSPLLDNSKLPVFSLRWLGHEKSDEISTFLKVMKAKNWQEFREAFSTYRVSAQNFLYADKEGNIGHILAAGIPQGALATASNLFGDTENKQHNWGDVMTSTDLPSTYNPQSGIIYSANNRPVQTEPRLTFFANGNARMNRIASLIDHAPDKLDFEFMVRLQTDTTDPLSLEINKKVIKLLADDSYLNKNYRECLDELGGWSGSYHQASNGALLFHLMISRFANEYYTSRYSSLIGEYILRSQAVYDFISEDMDREGIRAPLRAAFVFACEESKNYADWGEFHSLNIQHVFANIPLVGSRYRFLTLPASGSSATLRKAAHGLSEAPMSVRYGQNSRHISDLSSIDANYFVLLGGQDGWLQSTNFLDQVNSWSNGDYIQLPLSLGTVRNQFPHRVIIEAK